MDDDEDDSYYMESLPTIMNEVVEMEDDEIARLNFAVDEHESDLAYFLVD